MIPHNRPTLGCHERDALQRVLESGWLAQGAEVDAFENEVCARLGLADGHAVALSSGTAALYMALWVLSAKGRSVAIPAYSCAALRNAVVMAGAHPMPLDVAERSPNIDVAEIVRKKADLAVVAHMFGVPSPVGGIPVPVIEDCAQAFGARIDGEPVGLSGKVGVFSFYATKMITTGGQGGMLVSRDKSLVDQVRDYREFDCRRDRKPRFNFQMTDLQAAVGRVQLMQIDSFLQRRQEIYGIYADRGLPLWSATAPSSVSPAHYRALIETTDQQRIILTLGKAKVRAIIPIEDWELLDDAECLPHARVLARTLVSIPIYPSLPVQDAERIADTLWSALS